DRRFVAVVRAERQAAERNRNGGVREGLALERVEVRRGSAVDELDSAEVVRLAGGGDGDRALLHRRGRRGVLGDVAEIGRERVDRAAHRRAARAHRRFLKADEGELFEGLCLRDCGGKGEECDKDRSPWHVPCDARRATWLRWGYGGSFRTPLPQQQRPSLRARTEGRRDAR